MTSGKCLRTLEGHSGRVCCVIQTRDGKIISGSWDESIKVMGMLIWDRDVVVVVI
jgi:WD40 repeat protein